MFAFELYTTMKKIERLNKSEVASLIPHSGDMVLLDQVTAIDSENIYAECAANTGEVWFQEGSHEHCPTLLTIEYGAQAAAVHAATQGGLSSERPAYIGAIKKYEAHQPTFSRQHPLILFARRLLAQENGAIYEIEASQHQKVVAQFRLILNKPTMEN